MARPIKTVAASAEVRAELERRARASTSAHRDRFRAQIILLRLDGLKIADVAERMGTSMPTVSIWSSRFEKSGLVGLKDKTGRGRKPSIPAKKIERVVSEVTRPPKTRTRWSVRSMSRHVGISPSSVQRIWSRSELKPHIVKTFKLSNDPDFEAKFWDRALSRPAQQRDGALLRREEPVPGLGAHPARAAAGAEAAAHHDA